jgi:hypothetical protein
VPSLTGNPAASNSPIATAEGNVPSAVENNDAHRESRSITVSPPIRIDDEALVRLEAELANSKPVPVMSDQERYEEALAWVQSNRPPDWPYQEVEARILGTLSTILDGDRRSAGWLMNVGMIEFELIRALDANGDGAITLAEMHAYSQADISNLGELDHPFLLSRIDTDRDGVLSDDERSVTDSVDFFQEGAFAGVFDRAELNAWDANNDGVLTEDERLAGQTELTSKNEMLEITEAQMLEMEANGLFDGPDGEARRIAAEAQLAQLQSSQDEVNSIALLELARPLIEAMTFQSIERDDIHVPPPPKFDPPARLSFDTDGDGTLNPVEQQQYMVALDAFNVAQSDTGWQNAQQTRSLFAREATIGDINRDGLFTPTEWDIHLSSMSRQRDAQLFKVSYDLDRDGRVNQTELTTFVDWYRAGSLRADSNYDGLVDARDLEFMMNNYQRQN